MIFHTEYSDMGWFVRDTCIALPHLRTGTSTGNLFVERETADSLAYTDDISYRKDIDRSGRVWGSGG